MPGEFGAEPSGSRSVALTGACVRVGVTQGVCRSIQKLGLPNKCPLSVRRLWLPPGSGPVPSFPGSPSGRLCLSFFTAQLDEDWPSSLGSGLRRLELL